MRDEQPWTTCPRCRNTVYWTFSDPPAMPRNEEDYDETDWYCGACLEAVHFFSELAFWREQGLEALQDHNQWRHDNAPRRAPAAA